ncbi:MAG: hypothetical protein B7Z24_04500 [Pseudomonadales bacterium 32-42-5]|nr:MAG: hypothetical protein B7Z24_04500 [Pseudomonadales bacterium 32-42-5]
MAGENQQAKTLYDKLWDDHLVKQRDDGSALLYIDRHLLHEVTSPQAFEGLQLAGRKPWRLSANVATPDHNVPTSTKERSEGIAGIEDDTSRIQVQTLDDNCKTFNVVQFDINDVRQGIAHVVGPEQGLTLPGMTVVCGDSHTATHGAFGCLAHGIGTSEVEHVLATQCLVQKKMKNMLVRVDGQLGQGVTPKDVVLAIIGKIGTAGGTGHAIEFGGQVFRDMSIEGRMTVCNMAIEGGARVGMVAVDDKTISYVKDRPYAPQGAQWDAAVAYWNTLHSDADAHFDTVVVLQGEEIEPQVSWGTSPEMVIPVTQAVPTLEQAKDEVQRNDWMRAYNYMGLTAGQALADIQLDRVFIGSCTNSRIEDIRAAAEVAKGKKVASTIKQAMVVPGSGLVKAQAEAEGLDKVLIEAGFEWREPGCSMCLAMNADKLQPGDMIKGGVVPQEYRKPVEQGIVAPLDRANVDTDLIIPKQFLKSIKRTGFGENLFDELRYLDEGFLGQDNSKRPKNPDFALNQPRYQGASILISRANFGCGSSREHAPWALEEYGFRTVIAPSYADIFFNNSFKNGMLPVILSEEIVDQLFKECAATEGYQLTIDLDAQEVRTPSGEAFTFEVDPFRKHCLLNGLDDIGLTLQVADDIKAYEEKTKASRPWVFAEIHA